MACFVALHGLHMVGTVNISDRWIFYN